MGCHGAKTTLQLADSKSKVKERLTCPKMTILSAQALQKSFPQSTDSPFCH